VVDSGFIVNQMLFWISGETTASAENTSTNENGMKFCPLSKSLRKRHSMGAHTTTQSTEVEVGRS